MTRGYRVTGDDKGLQRVTKVTRGYRGFKGLQGVQGVTGDDKGYRE